LDRNESDPIDEQIGMIPDRIEEFKSSNLNSNARFRNKAPKRVFKSSEHEIGRKRKYFSSS
jgi:hypothetical protein